MSKPNPKPLTVFLFFLTLFLLAAGNVEAKSPVISTWWKNLSYTPLLEPADPPTTWEDQFGDLQVVGKTVHTLWYGRKSDWTDDRFVYRRSPDEGASWGVPKILASQSEFAGSTLVKDESAKYLCVNGSTVHVVIPRSFPISSTRSWYYNLYYYRSLDNGVTFEPARLLVAGEDVWHITQPRIACNAARVVIGYRYAANWYNNYRIPLLISENNGTTFRSTTATATVSYEGSFEDLALSGTDIHVMHRRVLEPYYYGNFQARIGVSSSSDNATTFAERWLTTQASDGRYYGIGTKDYYNSPDLAVVGSTVSVIWTQYDTNYNGTKTLMFRQSLDKGKTFGAAKVLYKGNELYNGQPTLAAKGNHLYVLFPTSDGKMRLRRSVDGGATFLAAQVVSDTGGWWPEVRFSPDEKTGATVYFFWDSPSFRRSVDGGKTLDKVMWLYPAYTTGNYQRSHRVVAWGQKIHNLSSAQLYSLELCDGYCDRDMLYRKIVPAPAAAAPGSGLRLYTESVPFENRADNMQAQAKTLGMTGALTAEVWVADMGGGMGTGYTDYHTPIFFKQAAPDPSAADRAYSIGTQATVGGGRRIIGELRTTTGFHRIVAEGDAGLLPAQAWTHLALVYDPQASENNLRLVKNGTLIARMTVTGNVVPGNGNLIVGRYGNWVVDELRIWARPLSATELKAKSAGPLTGSETGLRAYYNFDKTTRDITGRGNDGILMYKERYFTGRH